jgi:hypothetical protein
MSEAKRLLERLTTAAEGERSKGTCDGWVHPLPDGTGHEPGEDTIHVLPFHHDGDPCEFCEATDEARAFLARLRESVPAS